MTNFPLVAFDLDGTLCKSKTSVTEEMAELITKLLSKIPVAVMSGGWYLQFQKQFLPALPANAQKENLYLFPTSAASCYRFQGDEWREIYENNFSLEEKQKILSSLEQALEKAGLKEPPAQVWGQRIQDRGGQITFSALGQEAPVEAKKAWDPNKKKRIPVWKILLQTLPEFNIAMNATTSVDITRKGITKAHGVRKLSEMTGIPIPEMLYVGDGLFEGGNDVVVKETGILTQQVSGPEETTQIINGILEKIFFPQTNDSLSTIDSIRTLS